MFYDDYYVTADTQNIHNSSNATYRTKNLP